jgi:hypothetical protein
MDTRDSAHWRALGGFVYLMRPTCWCGGVISSQLKDTGEAKAHLGKADSLRPCMCRMYRMKRRFGQLSGVGG